MTKKATIKFFLEKKKKLLLFIQSLAIQDCTVWVWFDRIWFSVAWQHRQTAKQPTNCHQRLSQISVNSYWQAHGSTQYVFFNWALPDSNQWDDFRQKYKYRNFSCENQNSSNKRGCCTLNLPIFVLYIYKEDIVHIFVFGWLSLKLGHFQKSTLFQRHIQGSCIGSLLLCLLLITCWIPKLMFPNFPWVAYVSRLAMLPSGQPTCKRLHKRVKNSPCRL